MKKNIFTYSPVLALIASFSLCLTSCNKDGDSTIVIENASYNVAGIPNDDEASDAPYIDGNTVNIGTPSSNVENIDGETVIRLDLNGIYYSDEGEWLHLYGMDSKNQNIWVTVDGEPKGFTVYNTADDEEHQQISKTDLVFLVDNSGSMDEEADAVARDIINWADKLAVSGLDIKFSCVGYSVNGHVNGAIDFTSSQKLADFLNFSNGTSRTIHFDSTVLSNYAKNYSYVSDECGVLALRFADSYFNFRNGATRVYVNFTDEPNQPNRNSNYSVYYIRDSWNNMGTIHTVYSGDTNDTWSDYYREKPWLMSEFSGGESFFTNSNFYGVSLDDLPVTGALRNTYIIRFTNIDNLKDGQYHTVKITIYDKNGKAKAEKTINVIFR